MAKTKDHDFIIIYYQHHNIATYDEYCDDYTEEVCEEEWRIDLHLNEYLARYWFEYFAQTLPKGELELIMFDLDEHLIRVPGTRKKLETRAIKETDNVNRPKITPYEFYEKYVIEGAKK